MPPAVMLAIRRRALIIGIGLAASTVAQAARGADEPRTIAERIDIATVHPVLLAERDIDAESFRMLTMSQGWGPQVPGVGTRNYEQAMRLGWLGLFPLSIAC